MLKTLPTRPALLFGSFLYRNDLHSQDQLLQLWQDIYGTSDLLVPAVNPLIEYYTKEMSGPLARFIVITQKAYPRDEFLPLKLRSMEWERAFAVNGQRMVNVDTGHLSPENFILATTKNYSHRIYVGSDIFADLTYEFKQGQYRFLPWTYPDYQDDEKVQFLTQARHRLLASFLPMT